MHTLRTTTAAKIDKIDEPSRALLHGSSASRTKASSSLRWASGKIDAIADALIQTINANNSIALATMLEH